MRIEVDRRPVAAAWRNRRSILVAVFTPNRDMGVTVHRAGGLSIVGFPRRGGTTIAVGRLKQRMDTLAEDCRRHTFGPVGVYTGKDF